MGDEGRCADCDALRAENDALRKAVRALEQRTEIDLNRLTLGRRVSEGHFGEVFAGTYQGAPVAVKKLKIVDARAIQEFEAEIALLRALPPHPNILQFIGAVTDPGNLCIVTRFCELGSLFDYLKDGAPLAPRQRKNVMVGIACGMAYLHSNRIIHRDLASRNVLLDSSVSPYLSDVGLSRHLGADANEGMWSKAASVPLRFLAPESATNRTFSPKSDVWAFGLVLVEIFTRDQPYASLKAKEVVLGLIRNTVRPEVPAAVAANEPVVAKIMAACWQFDPLQRPEFDDIHEALETIIVPADGLDRVRPQIVDDASVASKESWLIDEHKVVMGERLAEGSSGIVWKCKLGATEYALKQLKVANAESLEGIRREFALLKQLRHPNVVMLIGLTTGTSPSLMTELAERGSLRGFLHSTEKISPDLFVTILLGVSCGLDYLHSRGIVHRDISARNILLDHQLRAKICDFDLAIRHVPRTQTAQLESSMAADRSVAEEDVLPWKYLPPECQISVASEQRRFSPASDVWSFGMLSIEVYSRSDLFPDLSAEAAGALLASGELEPRLPTDVDAHIKDCLSRCWLREPASRPTMFTIAETFSRAVPPMSQPAVDTGPSSEPIVPVESGNMTYTVEVRLPVKEFSAAKIQVDLDATYTVRQAVRYILRLASSSSKDTPNRSPDLPRPSRSRSSSTSLFDDLRALPNSDGYSFVVNNADVPDSTRLSEIAFLLKGLPYVEIRSTRVPKEVTEACAQILSRGLEARDLFLWPALAQQSAHQADVETLGAKEKGKGSRFSSSAAIELAEKEEKRNKRFSRGVSFRAIKDTWRPSVKDALRGRATSDASANGPSAAALAARFTQLRVDVQSIESNNLAGRHEIWGTADISAVAETLVLYLFKRPGKSLCSEDLLAKSTAAQQAQRVLDGQGVVDDIAAGSLSELVASMDLASQAILFAVIRMLFVYSRNASINGMHPSKLASVFATLIFGGAVLPAFEQDANQRKRHSTIVKTGLESAAWIPVISSTDTIKTLVCEALINNFESTFYETINDEEKHAQLPVWRGTVVAHTSSVNGMAILEAEQDTLITWSSTECRIWALRNGSVTPGKLATLLRDQARDDPILDVVVGMQPNKQVADVWISSVQRIQVCRLAFDVDTKGGVEKKDRLGAIAGPTIREITSIQCLPTGCASLVRSGGLILGSPCAGTPGVSIWSVTTFDFLGHVAAPRLVTAMSIVDEHLWAGTDDGGVCVWAAMGRVLTPVAQIPPESRSWPGKSSAVCSPHAGKIRSVVGVPDGSDDIEGGTVWTSSNDGLVCIWSVATHEPLRSFKASSSRVSLTWHSGFVWACTWEGTVKVFMPAGSPVVELRGHHEDGVTALAFCFDDQRRRWRFFTSSYDRTVCVWVMPTRIVPVRGPGRLETLERSDSFRALDLAGASSTTPASGIEASNRETIRRLANKALFFHASLTKSASHKLLRHREAGSFLFRPSSEPLTLAADIVAKSGRIKHMRYACDERRIYDGDEAFQTLQDLVASRPALFVHPFTTDEASSHELNSSTGSFSSSDDLLGGTLSLNIRSLVKQGAILAHSLSDSRRKRDSLVVSRTAHGTLVFLLEPHDGAELVELAEVSVGELQRCATNKEQFKLGDEPFICLDAQKIRSIVLRKWSTLLDD